MKVLLTRPAYSPLYLLITSKTKYKAVSVPIGLLYVAAALEIDGHQVEIVDGEADNLTPGDLVKRIEASQPDIVGAGATTVDFDDANLALREVNKAFIDHLKAAVYYLDKVDQTSEEQRKSMIECLNGIIAQSEAVSAEAPTRH